MVHALLQSEPLPSVTKRRHAMGKIWQAGTTMRFTRSLYLAATLPRSFSNADSGVTENSPRTGIMGIGAAKTRGQADSAVAAGESAWTNRLISATSVGDKSIRGGRTVAWSICPSPTSAALMRTRR
jgi:hypothetical protein